MKPKHQGGYTQLHSDLCERTLVTLLRRLGPYKKGIYLIGGLVPRYLLQSVPIDKVREPHIGTTDVDIVLDLLVLEEVEAYKRLEDNLKAGGFERGVNDEGQPQHYRWTKRIDLGVTIAVDLLCDSFDETGGQVIPLVKERRLSALTIPGARLAVHDFVEIEIAAELLDDAGVATETIQVANIAPFITLKAQAYEDRMEQKDAYDIIYCLMYYGNGPKDVAAAFENAIRKSQDKPLILSAIDILQNRFCSDRNGQGYRKDGPKSYANFLTDPGQSNRDALNQRNAASVAEEFIARFRELYQEEST